MADKTYITQTLGEWREEGRRRFGPEFENWKFRCPACGHVASGKDFKNADAEPNDMYQCCIGRFNGKGADGMKGKDEGHGCNWAAFGLLGNLGKGSTVITPEGKKIDVFDFADEEKEEKTC